MKKFALALCLVMAFGSVASAAPVTYGTTSTVTVEGRTTWVNGNPTTTRPAWSNSDIAVTAKASGTGWSAEAALNYEEDLKLNSFKYNAKDGKFDLTFWGGRDLADKGTPFSYVFSPKAGGSWKARGIYDIVTVDFNGNAWAFVEKPLDQITLGGAYHNTFLGTQIIDGYAKATIGKANVTGEAAYRLLTPAQSYNTKLGIKADVAATDSVQIYGEAQTHAKNWGDYNKLYGKVTYKPASVWGAATVATSNVSNDATWRRNITLEAGQEKDFTKFYGSIAQVANKASEEQSKTLTFIATYRGGKDVAYDWLFDVNTSGKPKYYQNKAMAAQLSFVNSKGAAADANATNTITVKATSPIIANKAWIVGALQNVSDADAGKTIPVAGVVLGDASTTSNTKLDVDARYIADRKSVV